MLVQNGEVAVTEGEEVGKAMSSNPRTAIGFIDPLHIVLAVSDGRTADSVGLTLADLARVMREAAAPPPTTWTAAVPPPCISTAGC